MSGKILNAGFNIRPYTSKLLEVCNKHFEVLVFTASHKWYADVILDYLDPENQYFQHRLYRDHCILTKDNVYIKDLRILRNRELKDMIIVDNAVYSFGAQLANGIPITPFKDDKEDYEFINLIDYLENIKDLDDLRIPNRAIFKMEQVYKFNLDSYIEEYDYDLCEQRSDDEYSGDEEEGKSEVPNNVGSDRAESNRQNNSNRKLPKTVKEALDGFSMKIAKNMNLRTKFRNSREQSSSTLDANKSQC